MAGPRRGRACPHDADDGSRVEPCRASGRAPRWAWVRLDHPVANQILTGKRAIGEIDVDRLRALSGLDGEA